MKNFAVLFALIFVLTSCAAPVATQPPTATPLPPTATSLPPTATPVPPTDTPAPTATNTPIPTPTDTPIPPTSASGETVLELVGQTGSKSLTMAELETLPYVEGQAGIKSSTGQITLPALYRGVPIAELAKLIGDFSPEFGVNVVAKDGYAMTMSYEQITTGDFIQYDPATGAEKKEKEPLTMILAYARDGQPIPAAEEGPLRLAIISEKNDQVTDGHWSVKWVNKIELKPLGAEWSLQLHGVIDREVDRNSFQSCSAPGCHQATWIDDKAQNWVGIPLYLLAGKMDDLIEHEGPAFNDYLAQVGWLLEIVATDGYSVTLDSKTVARNPDLIVAYQVNDNPLPEQYFPLRLVGNAVSKKEMIGQIDHMNLLFDKNAAATVVATQSVPTAEPTQVEAKPAMQPGQLMITGLVEEETILTQGILKALGTAKIQAEHPKKGIQSYEGILLKTLLDLVKVKPGAKSVFFTASDGYSVEASYNDVAACKDCIVAFTETPGSYLLVMPGFDSSYWVKDLMTIEIK